MCSAVSAAFGAAKEGINTLAVGDFGKVYRPKPTRRSSWKLVGNPGCELVASRYQLASSDQEYLTRYFSYIAPPQGPLVLNYVGPQPPSPSLGLQA